VVSHRQLAVIEAAGVVAPAHALDDHLPLIIGELAHPAPELTGPADTLRLSVEHKTLPGAAVFVPMPILMLTACVGADRGKRDRADEQFWRKSRGVFRVTSDTSPG